MPYYKVTGKISCEVLLSHEQETLHTRLVFMKFQYKPAKKPVTHTVCCAVRTYVRY